MEKGEAPAEVDAADVSAVGTLVWVRRANGSWWPGRVVSPNEVPDCCPAPPRSPATPILLLGRRDGPVFVEWLNLERSKRVKPFRCGERGLEDCIRTAEEQAADRRLRSKTGAGGGTRYARKDDAVLQALEIERASLRSSSSRPTTTTSKPSHSAPAATASGRKRRRTPNDSEDDAPQRMKDLTDIGKHATPNAPAFTDLNQHLPSTSQMKRSKQSHHDSAKRNQPGPTADQDQDQDHPCGISRRRDRSRPLSELCNGDAWNGHRPNGQRPHQHLMHAASSLGMVLDNKPSSRRAVGPVKTELGYGDMWKNGLKPNGQRADQHPIRAALSLDTVLDTRSSSRRAIGPVKTEPVDDGFPVNVHLAATSIMKTDHLHVHQPCASTKAPTQEHTKQASNCSKDGISSQCDSRSSKKKTITSVDHEGINKTKTVPESEHRRERAAKHRAPSNEVILLEKRVEKSAAADKTAAPADDYKGLAVLTPNGLDCVGRVLQQHSGIKCKVEEPAETTSNHPNRENVPAPSVVFELPPHQVLPPQQRDLVAAGCHAVKPVKTLQLNSSIYDVEISAQGGSSGSKGGRVPLVSLMSKSSRRPVVGYPVTVEVLDDTAPRPPTPSVHDHHHPSTSNTVNRPMKVEEEEAAAPALQCAMPLLSSHRAARTTQAKVKSRRKASDDDESWRPHTKNSPVASSSANLKSRRKTTEDETWRPHTKNPVSSSPRKMRRLSSFGPSQRGAGGGDRRPAAVGPFAVACIPLRLVFSRIHEALS
ncbi:hypothetical protein ACQ4PT_039295 [Festuca glaucescens]